MFHAEPNPDRAQLRFEEEVLDSFSFLRTEFGFRVVESELTRVRYESDKVFVNVYHGRSSYELGCEIGLFHEHGNANAEVIPENAYSIWEIARMQSAPKITKHTFYQASTRDTIGQLVPRLADLLRTWGEPALSGDPAFYQTLEHAHSKWFEEYQRETKLTRIRQQLLVAWRARDFSRVVSLLTPVAHDLTPSELRKLEYARSKL
jgi:hypothetical protein